MPRKMPIRCHIGDMSYIHACPREYSGIPPPLAAAVTTHIINREIAPPGNRWPGVSAGANGPGGLRLTGRATSAAAGGHCA